MATTRNPEVLKPDVPSEKDDSAERTRAEEALHEALRELQIVYDQSILYAKKLNKETAARKSAEQQLRERQRDLKTRTNDLEEANAALKVLLRHREEDKGALEAKVLSNVRTLILPCVHALKKTRLDRRQQTLLDLIDGRVREIVSSYVVTLASKAAGLTPKEIQVATLIKEGKATKEIGDILHVSTRAVEFHRYNIRKKLGLTSSKTNLRTHLLSLP
jgi:DNA-binding CsgD family transcriptional regulator